MIREIFSGSFDFTSLLRREVSLRMTEVKVLLEAKGTRFSPEASSQKTEAISQELYFWIQQ